MSSTRVKDVNIDGAEFKISSLTVEQVEQYLSPLEALASNKLIEVKGRTYQLICHGLNNVHADEDGNLPADYKPWTPDKVRKKLDLVLIDRLNEEIITFSGLQVVKVQGERQAVPASPVAHEEQVSSASVA